MKPHKRCGWGHPIMKPNMTQAGGCLACTRVYTYMRKHPNEKHRRREVGDRIWRDIMTKPSFEQVLAVIPEEFEHLRQFLGERAAKDRLMKVYDVSEHTIYKVLRREGVA